jgi:hypothetical protein
VNVDGSITDGTATIQKGEDGYYLLKAMIDAGGKFERKVMTIPEMKTERAKKTVGSFKWFKLGFKIDGLDIDRSGFKAMMIAIGKQEFDMSKVIATLKEYNNKTITETIVDISLGKSTEKTAKRLALLKEKEDRAKLVAENKAKRFADKLAMKQAKLSKQRATTEKKIAEQQAKLQLNIAKMEAQAKELEKQKSKL